MSNIIYYIGVGASYGKKKAREVIEKGIVNEKLLIHERLPVIIENGKYLFAFKKAVANAPIATNVLRAVLLNESASKIVYQKDCMQFFLLRIALDHKLSDLG